MSNLKKRKRSTFRPKIDAPQLKKIILYCAIELQKLQELGKTYPWKKPRYCPGCRSKRLWGHGTVIRYFYGYDEGLYLKRWRCPECGSIHTVRPETHQSRHQYTQEIIRKALAYKLAVGCFRSNEASRQNQQYWYKNLKRWFHAKALALNPRELAMHVRKSAHLRVSRSVSDRLIEYGGASPYRRFALSSKGSSG